jgi:hypothetical protein
VFVHCLQYSSSEATSCIGGVEGGLGGVLVCSPGLKLEGELAAVDALEDIAPSSCNRTAIKGSMSEGAED